MIFFMAEFVYNKAKNANNGHMSFKFNCKYYLLVFYKEDPDPYLKLKIAEKQSF